MRFQHKFKRCQAGTVSQVIRKGISEFRCSESLESSLSTGFEFASWLHR